MSGAPDEVDGGLAAGVVDSGDGADVVPVVRTDLHPDGDVPCDVVESLSLVEELGAGGAVGAGGGLFGPDGVAVEGFEVDEGVGSGPGGDGVEVRVDAVGESFGGGSGEATGEVLVDGVGLFVGWDESTVVAFGVELGAAGR